MTAWEVQLMQARPGVVSEFLAEHAPPILDPFCGGGSIPLEAQRLGLRPYASDLNPVPVLITKALIEIPARFAGSEPVNPEWEAKSKEEKAATPWQGAQGLAEDIRFYGEWMKSEAEKRVKHLYPRMTITAELAKERPDLQTHIGESANVIAWLWTRTVASPNPVCDGAHVPLMRTFWLSTKKGKDTWLEPIIDRNTNSYEFAVRFGRPTNSYDPSIGTLGRKGGRCLLSGEPMGFPYIRNEGQAGRMKVRLFAIVVELDRRRVYLPADAVHERIAKEVQPNWTPDLELPDNPRDFKTPNYGLSTFAELFTKRQLVMLNTLSELVEQARSEVVKRTGESDGNANSVTYADAIATYLALGVDKLTDYNCTLVTWIMQRDQAGHAFTKQALPMVWDYTEVNPFVGAAGDITVSLKGISKVVESAASIPTSAGVVYQLDATEKLPGVTKPVVCTDPPYYDNISYAELSDFFYVWLRRALQNVYPMLFSTVLTPKSQELIASPYRHDGNKEDAQSFFERGFEHTFKNLRDAQCREVPLTVFYAFKQVESGGSVGGSEVVEVLASTGWETMLSGLIRAGLSIHGTWPMRTERGTRSLGIGKNALASSVVLVCRPLAGEASLATRKEFMNALRGELPDALRSLQHGNIAPVDLAQAAIGPGMAVFTRYSKVMETDGSPMSIRTALGIINQVLDEVLAEQEGDFDGDTRWALSWFDEFGVDEGPFGVAESLSKAKNTAVNGLVDAGIITAKGGAVRLVRRDELNGGWDPATDERLTVWEVAQHLIRTLETEGEAAAARLVHKLGGMAETARELAYRLYSMCERKKWADEALAYNGLVIAWPELTKLAMAQRSRQPETQQDLFTTSE